MTDHRRSRFTSYIDEKEFASISLSDSQKTKILDGETTVCEAQKVLLYAPLTNRKKPMSGILTVTTFKLSFASAEDQDAEFCYQQNLLLGPNDVCLSSIDTIHQIGDKSRKKLLSPGQSVSGKVKELLIICKNMRSFGFKFTDKDGGKNVTNALLHHAYPKRHSLLFAYDHKEPCCTATFREVCLFRKRDNWKKELDRTKCDNWRASVVNENFQTSHTMMSTLIVPKSVNDSALMAAIEHFRNRCCPVWVWGTSRGAALVRMADLLPTIQDRTQENVLLEHIRKSHPEKKQPYIIDLTKECPSPKDIQLSFLKLRDLCVPENARTFKNQDFKFYGLLDATKWMSHVSACLSKAVEGAKQMHEESSTVVLQEGNGQDLNCVISSLIQLMMDPHFRTRYGFQSLMQKDWIAIGHPFANRLGHILSKEIEQSPVFLLFLDCAWQLMQQYPTAFQFSETYLTTVWDSAHISIFDTFLFNCEHDRVLAEAGSAGHSPLILRSVWDWSEQFTEKDVVLFCNPLYDDSFKSRLQPNTSVAHLDMWTQCYCRWLPDLEILNGGRPQVDLCNRFIVSDIFELREKIQSGELNGRSHGNKEHYLELMRKVNSFFPFSRNNGQATGVLSINNVLLSGDLLDSQSILNLNND